MLATRLRAFSKQFIKQCKASVVFMNEKRVAILGTYRSGSSIISAMLNAMGVDMGAPFWRDYFEPEDLVPALRRWWREPDMVADEPASNRVLLLRQWLESRRATDWVGCKHPLLCLSAQDVLRAWGNGSKFIWCHRPLQDSITSLAKLNWWPDPARIQETLYSAADSFFPRPNGLVIEYDDTITDPNKMVLRLIDFLNLSPTPEQIAAAEKIVRRASQVTTVVPDLRVQDSSEASCKIVATLIAHNCESVIGDAVRSVADWVDQILLIDTGITDSSLVKASEIAGNKLVVHHFKWENDFSAARNFALKLATDSGADWACTLDSDERIGFYARDPLEFRDQLRQFTQAKVLLAKAADGSYCKERLIRLPTQVSWTGRTHETLSGVSRSEQAVLQNLVFSEVTKSKEELSKKFERDLTILRTELRTEPESGRKLYYLGQTLVNLGQHEGAIACFDRCSQIRDSDELAAWSSYMSAKSHAELGLFDEAIERCAIGMAIDALSPETAWLAAWSCFKIREYTQAIAWSRISISLGMYQGIGKLSNRFGFRDLIGWYEGPFDILFHTYIKLNESTLASQAKADFERARDARLASVSYNAAAVIKTE